MADDFSLYRNWYSWDRLADYVWVDQPVCVFNSSPNYTFWSHGSALLPSGVGFATVDNTGFGMLSPLIHVHRSSYVVARIVADEDQMGVDFVRVVHPSCLMFTIIF